MTKFRQMLVSCFSLLLSSGVQADEKPPAGWQAPVLTAIDGAAVTFTEAQLQVYCMLGTECPVSRFYASRLDEMAKQYANSGVRFVGIHCNLHDSEADVRGFAKELGLSFPQVHDVGQVLAQRLAATRVPEVVLIDAKGRICYRGRVDDQYAPGVKRAAPAAKPLQSAIENLLAGKEPLESHTEPVGCLITFSKPAVPATATPLTYCKTIAPLFNEHCVECHRPGEIGPFDISNYAELRGWAEMIVEVVEQKRMPPWHADPQYGAFKNERHMPESAVGVLKEWVKAGAPYGDATDLPPQSKFVDGWRLTREPELVVAMRDKPYSIPANGSVDYQYFVVDPQITEDRWVSSAQIVPGNPAVVHHAIVFVRPPDGIEFQGIGWLTAYVPGQRATIFPPGFARKIPAGSKFVFQMHYTPNGQEQVDTSHVGLTFMEPSQVTHEVFTMVGINQEFEIPPGAPNHVVTSSVKRLPRDGQLLAIVPHMHLRGKAFELTTVEDRQAAAEATDEATGYERRVLLKVPQYDFNWQHTYELVEPLSFSDIESLELTTTFDNSAANPFNPAPQEYVVWGDQTWEEMAVVFLEVAQPWRGDVPERAPNAVPAGGKRSDAATEKQLAYASKFLAKFDLNKDGRVVASEVPRIVQDFAFRRIDEDGDKVISRAELIEAARTQRGK